MSFHPTTPLRSVRDVHIIGTTPPKMSNNTIASSAAGADFQQLEYQMRTEFQQFVFQMRTEFQQYAFQMRTEFMQQMRTETQLFVDSVRDLRTAIEEMQKRFKTIEADIQDIRVRSEQPQKLTKSFQHLGSGINSVMDSLNLGENGSGTHDEGPSGS
ncbi:MAG: hypothetical protein M1839_006750 [Geoglossum umbratile]|nr:MAG: hypothetical protein M1839_006750 [Geoglossum umbratile]